MVDYYTVYIFVSLAGYSLRTIRKKITSSNEEDGDGFETREEENSIDEPWKCDYDDENDIMLMLLLS
jgi:hypothetical protein